MALRRKAEEPERPKLLERVLESGVNRVGILGLHPRAGTRTVLASLVRQLHGRELPYGVTSFPRLTLDDDLTPEPVTRIALPAGTSVACVDVTPTGESVELELIESTRFEGPGGDVGLYRLSAGGEIELTGPGDPEAMSAALRRLAEVSGGVALVDGGWDRRAFAAPGVTDGIVLSMGAGYSATPERAAAAARFLVDTFRAAECGAAERVAWREAVDDKVVVLLDGNGVSLATLPVVPGTPLRALAEVHGTAVASLVIPGNLNDTLLAPLVRDGASCRLVVRDATRVSASPVYLKAWEKAGGTVRVVYGTRLIALTTNPVNFSGEDADARRFHSLVAEAVPDLPVHDVVLESEPPSRRPVWKFWE